MIGRKLSSQFGEGVAEDTENGRERRVNNSQINIRRFYKPQTNPLKPQLTSTVTIMTNTMTTITTITTMIVLMTIRPTTVMTTPLKTAKKTVSQLILQRASMP